MARRQTKKREQWEEEVEQLFSDADGRDMLTMAGGYWAYYVACRKSGFNDSQAMAMIIAMQTTFLERAQDNQEKKGPTDG